MADIYSRTRLLIGEEGIDILRSSHVAVFGVGGVGGAAVEALARSGIGELTLVDNDIVGQSNLNRQIIALSDTLGRSKTETMAERIHKINDDCIVHTSETFFDAETSSEFDFSEYDYVIDAIDTVKSKLLLIETCYRAGVNVISCMGTGNRMDPSRLKICDISKTFGCPLARIMRGELKRRGIKKLLTVFSDEMPLKPLMAFSGDQERQEGKALIGSMTFVPSSAGIMMASQVVRHLLDNF